MITAPLDTVEHDYYTHVLDGAGLHGYEVAIEVTGIQARILAARAGLGVLVVFWPPFARRTELPGLTQLRVTEPDPPGPEFGVVQPLDEPAPPSVGTFTTWLRHITR